MNECICEGNWRKIIKESEPFFDKLCTDPDGVACRFIGVMHALDDYYYCMMGMDGKLKMLTCVGNLDTHGYKLTPS